jgi:hypothetical protein
MTEIKRWVESNSTLVYFLIAQLLAIATAGASILAYMVRLETRVSTMETRGAAYTVERMTKMDDRLTILEQRIESDEARLDRIVDIMTKKLNISP